MSLAKEAAEKIGPKGGLLHPSRVQTRSALEAAQDARDVGSIARLSLGADPLTTHTPRERLIDTYRLHLTRSNLKHFPIGGGDPEQFARYARSEKGVITRAKANEFLKSIKGAR